MTQSRTRRRRLALVIASAVLGGYGCEGGNSGSTSAPVTSPATATVEATATEAGIASVAAAMRRVVEERIVVAHRNLVTAANSLATAVETSCQPDLVGVQATFREVRLAWDAAKAYPLGPQLDRRLLAAVDWWPVDVDKVEATAAGDEPMTVEELDALGSTARGLRTIEYLLWADTPPTGRRCSYLERAAESIALKTTVVADDWVALADDFAGRQSALGDLLGALGESVYRVCDKELGMPVGAYFGSTGPDVSLVRQGGAAMAIDDVRALVAEIEAAYTAGVQPLIQERYPGEPDPMRLPFDSLVGSLDLLPPDLVDAIEQMPDFVVGATQACRQLRRELILTLPGLLGIVLVVPVGDGD